MSRDNVERVEAFYAALPDDLVPALADPEQTAALVRRVRDLFVEDFEIVGHGAEQVGIGRRHRGLEGLQRVFGEWLAPWRAYHARLEELIAVGDQVLALVRERGRTKHGDVEVSGAPIAAIWTLREGKVVRVDFYLAREEALRDTGG